jgi:flagellar protein FliS
MEIKTATPEMVIVKLYEGALRFIRTAEACQEKNDVPGRASAISKALAIVNELQHSLDLEKGGDVAANLDSLYFYVTDRLLSANAQASVEAMREASGVLSTLGEAWSEIARGPRATDSASA